MKSRADFVLFIDLAVREASKETVKETLLGELTKMSRIYPPQCAMHENCQPLQYMNESKSVS